MKPEKLFWLGLTLLTLSTSAQVVADPDWKETQAPPPPAFNKDRLIPVEMPTYVSLRFGIDPATLTLTHDGIVRYVMVAISATGSISAMYEGIRCASWEVKTYARSTVNEQWSSVKDPQWQGLGDNLPSKHALALARQGVCQGQSTTVGSAADIVNTLKNPNLGPFR